MPRSDHYAILMAINHYPGLTDLEGPENDARDFHTWLLDPSGGDLPPQNIARILSSDFPEVEDPYDACPTDTQLKKVLNHWLMANGEWKERVGERLWLYFAGHGYTAGVLSNPALYTAQAQMGDPQYIPGRLYAGRIQNAGFFDEIILVMDCCQDVLKCAQVTEPVWSPPDRQCSDRVKLMLAYGAPRGRRAYEHPDDQGRVRGHFTGVFLEALRTAPADGEGKVSARALEDTFQALWTTRHLKATGYTPPIEAPADLCLCQRTVQPAEAASYVKAAGFPRISPEGWKALDTFLLMQEGHAGPATVHASIQAHDIGVQITVLDTRQAKIAEGQDSLELDLPPGRYRVRFQLGDEVVHRVLDLEPEGEPVHVGVGRLTFSSPIPMPGTSSCREYHLCPAMTLEATHLPGPPSHGLVVFARDPEHTFGAGSTLSYETRHQLRLRRWTREGPEDVQAPFQVDPLRGAISLRLNLPSGLYLLGARQSFRGQPLWQELPLTLGSHAWRTEVYLNCSEDLDGQHRFDLEGAAILIAPADHAGYLNSREARLTEIARLRQWKHLGTGRRSPREPWGPDLGSPLLALFQAYELAAAEAVDTENLRRLCTYLRQSWSGSSPDLDLLECRCGPQEGRSLPAAPPALDGVPMLAQGWDLMARLFPAAPLPIEVQQQLALWRVEGPVWTLFQKPCETQVPGARSPASLSPFHQALRAAMAQSADAPGTFRTNARALAHRFCIGEALQDQVLSELANLQNQPSSALQP